MDEIDVARRCADLMYSGDRASQALGIEVEVTKAGTAEASMRIREDMVNGLRVCHGGLIFTLADTAFAFACNGYDQQTFAASAHIDFLRPAKLHDQLVATATEDHRGRSTGYYLVKIKNQRNELVALFRGRSVSNGESMLQDQSDT